MRGVEDARRFRSRDAITQRAHLVGDGCTRHRPVQRGARSIASAGELRAIAKRDVDLRRLHVTETEVIDAAPREERSHRAATPSDHGQRGAGGQSPEREGGPVGSDGLIAISRLLEGRGVFAGGAREDRDAQLHELPLAFVEGRDREAPEALVAYRDVHEHGRGVVSGDADAVHAGEHAGHERDLSAPVGIGRAREHLEGRVVGAALERKAHFGSGERTKLAVGVAHLDERVLAARQGEHRGADDLQAMGLPRRTRVWKGRVVDETAIAARGAGEEKGREYKAKKHQEAQLSQCGGEAPNAVAPAEGIAVLSCGSAQGRVIPTDDRWPMR